MEKIIEERAIVSLAKAAFTLYYAVTKKPGWGGVDEHWATPGCQNLWVSIVTEVARGLAMQAALSAARTGIKPKPLPGLGGPTPMPGRGNTAPELAGAALILDTIAGTIETVQTAQAVPGQTGGENLGQGNTAPALPPPDPVIRHGSAPLGLTEPDIGGVND